RLSGAMDWYGASCIIRLRTHTLLISPQTHFLSYNPLTRTKSVSVLEASGDRIGDSARFNDERNAENK
ncbi:MAG: hypothetical protein ACOYD7_03945, partial [Raoultibacter sp.]